MGQIADSLRSIVQTMKDGDEVFKQNLDEIKEAADALGKAAEALTETSLNNPYNPNHSFTAPEEVRTPVKDLPKSYFV